ncbi:MAG: helix-turn-helix transcriptional regulator [Provencibacterium sp.]|jgi:transcriptional regulator with XRE-family HTH domain|nr:helix-turn-helix transcriptional regulator [Provencibacterium sp.]
MRIKPKYRRALGTAIRKTRKSHDLTQEELSELVGLSPRWIQKIESGQSNPNWFNLLQMMAILELDADRLAMEVRMDVSVSAR